MNTANFNPRSPHGERLMASEVKSTYCDFNPRSPHGERQTLALENRAADAFQPTLPARGATSDAQQSCLALAISTHAPRTGSDASPSCN